MSSSRITYAPCPSTTPEGEIAALANVYRYIFDCHVKKKAARLGSPDDAEESKNDRTAEPKYTR